MRIELRRRHGFRVSRQQPVVVETADLPAAERQLMERLVEESGLLSPHASATSPPFGYTFIVEDAPGKRHESAMLDSELSPPLDELVAMLVKRAS